MTTKFATGFITIVLLVSLTGCAKENQLHKPSQTDIRLKQIDFSKEMEGTENWMGKPEEIKTQVEKNYDSNNQIIEKFCKELDILFVFNEFAKKMEDRFTRFNLVRIENKYKRHFPRSMWINFDQLSMLQYQKFKKLTDRAWRNKIDDLTYIHYSYAQVEKLVKFDEELKKRTPASDAAAGKVIYDKYSNVINHLNCKDLIKNHNNYFSKQLPNSADEVANVEELKQMFKDGRLANLYGSIISEIFVKGKK